MKDKTQQTYHHLLKRFEEQFGEREFETNESELLYHFLESLTEGLAKATGHLRYVQLKAFYNFIIETYVLEVQNPFSLPILSKSFRLPKQKARKILDKETIDEMIYNAKKIRDRLIMELQARCRLRIRESNQTDCAKCCGSEAYFAKSETGKR